MQSMVHGRLRELGDSPESLNRGFTTSRKRRRTDNFGAGSNLVATAFNEDVLILTFAHRSGTLFAVSFTCLRSLSCVDSVGFRG